MKSLKIKNIIQTLTSVLLILTLVISCARSVEYSQEGWSILANLKEEHLVFKHSDLGIILGNARLNLKKNCEHTQLTGWEIKKDKDKLTIITVTPDSTSWEFKITKEGVDISSSADNGVIIGVAPASEDRIPARTLSQDNEVMYTSLGFVSARNIYCLFDRDTDILIQFSEKSDLSRHTSNNKLMDVIIPLVKGLEISLILDYYTEEIGLARYQVTDFRPVYKSIPERFKRAPTGWCSWYCYYMAPTEEDMVKETDAIAEKLGPYGLTYIQLDACYTRGEEASYLNWTKETFPKGGKWLLQYIKERGLKSGLWVNAYGANYANPECADKYPENFFLRDKNGKLSSACCTADSTEVRLDYTNPEVIEKHLKPLFKTLVEEWGMEYLKDAGWGTWMNFYEENRAMAYDSTLDSRKVYREVQRVIRDIMGSNNYITGCAMHEIGVGFDYFNGSRTGGDDYASWTGENHWSSGMQTFFSSLFGANYLNGIVWWSDPDVVMVRNPLTMEEAKTIVSSIALSGQTYMISDFIADFFKERLKRFLSSKQETGWAKQYPFLVKALPEDRLELYRKTIPTMPIATMDLYPFKTEPICCPEPTDFPEALDLKVNSESGIYDVVSVYNWEGSPSLKTVYFEDDLGLDSGKKYLIFDFWNQELEGIFRDSIQTEIPAHGVRVFLIRSLSNSPQLLATSRHITGAFSIKRLIWDPSRLTLTGTSMTVPGDPYSLFIYLPEGLNLSQVDVDAPNLSHRVKSNRVMEISFQGQEKPVNWVVEFKSAE